MILPSDPLILFFSLAAIGAYFGRTWLWIGTAWILHSIALVVALFGVNPHFGFAPALSLTAWLMVMVYAVERIVHPQLATPKGLGMSVALAVAAALLFPGSFLTPHSSIWLALHLALGVACYGLFGIAVVHAWLMRRAEIRFRHAQDPGSGLPLLTLERLTYRFIVAGFCLLSATLLIGGILHTWRWDHKTVFSLLAWVIFGVLLTGRYGFGWRGKRAVQALYTGSLFLLLGYAGSRFVLEVILGRMP